MTSKTRYLVFAAAAVLTVGLGTGLLAYVVGFPTSALTRQGGPEELQFIPANVALVAAADVHSIMTSPLRDTLRAKLPMKGDGQAEFSAQTGINIDTDIDRVVAAVGRTDSAAREGQGLVLARGRFDAVRIEALMRDHGGQVEVVDGKRLIVGDTADGKHQVSLAFMEPGLIAVGSTGMVRSALALANGGASVTTNDEIMNLVRDLDSGTAWAVGRFDELTASASLPPIVSDKLPPIQWFSANVFVDGGIRGTIRAETRDEESANSLRDVVRGIMALARLQSSNHAQLERTLQSLTLGGTGKTVSLGFDVPAEFFDTLAQITTPRPNAQ